MNIFLVTTCWIYKKQNTETGILTQVNYKLCRKGNNLTSWRRNVPSFKCSFYSKFLIINTETKYWKILHIKKNHVHRLSINQRFKVKTCTCNITLILENMSDGHISILGNKKNICYKYNITDFLWNTFLLGGKIAWYNHQHFPNIKTELNGQNVNVRPT